MSKNKVKGNYSIRIQSSATKIAEFIVHHRASHSSSRTTLYSSYLHRHFKTSHVTVSFTVALRSIDKFAELIKDGSTSFVWSEIRKLFGELGPIKQALDRLNHRSGKFLWFGFFFVFSLRFFCRSFRMAKIWLFIWRKRRTRTKSRRNRKS